jgi:hypothetical protein
VLLGALALLGCGSSTSDDPDPDDALDRELEPTRFVATDEAWGPCGGGIEPAASSRCSASCAASIS